MLLEDHHSKIDPKLVYDLFISAGVPDRVPNNIARKVVGCSAVIAQWNLE
jgi:hypothetical protein